MWNTSPQIQQTHTHTRALHTHIFRKNDYVATIFWDRSFGSATKFIYIHKFLCFWCVCYYYCCLSQYSQCQSTLWMSGVIFMFVLLRCGLFVCARARLTQESTWKFTTICESIHYQLLLYGMQKQRKTHCNECNVHKFIWMCHRILF